MEIDFHVPLFPAESRVELRLPVLHDSSFYFIDPE
jgi:hypothetical protein